MASKFLFSAIIVLAFAAYAHGFVCSIDLGTKWMKIGVVKPGNPPINIAINVHSGRKTAAYMSLHDMEREFGADAFSKRTRFPDEVFSGLQPILGRTAEAKKIVANEFVPYDFRIDEERGTLLIHHDKANMTFTAEEIMGMIMKHANDIGDMNSHKSAPIKDCVITVPDYFTNQQREAVRDAGRLAGVKVLSLTNENTAVAMQFGLDRRGKWNETVQQVIFYNVGAHHVTASLVEYSTQVDKKNVSSPQAKVVGVEWDDQVGGNHWDLALARHLEKAFKEQSKISELTPRAMAKIHAEALRVKEVLSANTDTYAMIESLQDDRDFKLRVWRKDFEALTADLFERALAPLKRLVEKNGVDVATLHALELFGGGTRIPKLQDDLQAFLGETPIGRHLNTDEAAAMGAGFMAATLSSAFRAKSFKVIDTQMYGITAEFHHDDPEAKERAPTALFPEGSRFPGKKQVSFTETNDFHIVLAYNASNLPLGVPAPIGNYNITGIERRLEGRNLTSKPKVSVTFRISPAGIVSVSKAELSFSESKVVEEEYKVNITTPAEDADDAADAGADTAAESESGEDKKDEGSEGEGDKKEEGSEEGDGADKKKEEEKEKEKKKPAPKFEYRKRNVTKTFNRNYDLTVNSERLGVPAMSDDRRMAAGDRLYKLNQAEENKKLVDQAKNALESYMYKARDDMSKDGVSEVTTEEQRTELNNALMDTEDWLYGDGIDAPVADYNKKKRALEKLIEAVHVRISERDDRPAAISAARALLNLTRSDLANFNTSHPHIDEKSKASLLKKVEEVEKWLDEKVAAQDELKSHETPAVLSSEIYSKTKPVSEQLLRLRKRKPPKPKKKKKSKVKIEDSDASTNGTKADAGEEESKPEGEGKEQEKQSEEDTTTTTTEEENEKEEL